TVCNDVSEREYQLERGSQWDKGKGCDTFGPIGPWLVTADEIPNVQKLDMWLEPGDVITTGTPPGVGLGMKPPKYLKKGDVMTLGIQGLGEQRQAVIGF